MRFFTVAAVLFTVVVGVFAGPAVQRDTPKSAAVVLTDLSNAVTPLAHQLLYATSENATQATVKPIIGSMGTAVNGAISGMKLLVGQPTDVVMASVDGTSILSPSDIADLLAGIVNLIFEALEAVLQVVDSALVSIIEELVTTLGQLVFSLLGIVASLVIGLAALLLPLLAPVLSIIASLGLTGLLGGL